MDMTPELVAGLVASALVTAAIGGVLALNRPRGTRTRSPAPSRAPAPIGGVLIGGVTLLTLVDRVSVPFELVVGMVGVGVVTAIDPRRLATPFAVAIALPFAWFTMKDLDFTNGLLRTVVVVVAAGGAIAVARTDDAWAATGVTPILFAITAAGIFLAVPDTEQAGALFGVALPVALLGWPFRLASLGRAGSGAVTVLAVWTAAIGGRAAQGSIVAGCACLALLAGLAVGRFLASSDADLRRRLRPASAAGPAAGFGRVEWTESPALVVFAHGVLVLFASRIGSDSGLVFASVIAVVTAIASVAGGVAFRAPPGPAIEGRW
jgi:hypothetical protein